MISIPILSQTLWNESKTTKFRFLVPAKGNWIKYLENNDKELYDYDCLNYIVNESTNWYALKKGDDYLYFDNDLKLSYNALPLFFLDYNIINDRKILKIFFDTYLKDIDVKKIEFKKFSIQKILNFYKMF